MAWRLYLRPWTLLAVWLAVLCAGQDSGGVEDPDVAEFRAALASAIASDDMDALYSLAYETGSGGAVAQEVDQLKLVVSGYIEEAFRNQVARLDEAGAIMNVVQQGQAQGVSAGELDLARAKAIANAQAELERWLQAGDDDALREALATAVRAGVASAVLGPAQAHLREAADAELRDALTEGDLGTIIGAINRAAADGVPAGEIETAKQTRNTQMLQAISDAETSGDLRAKEMAVRTAANVGDPALADTVSTAKQALVVEINSTLGNAEVLISSDETLLKTAVSLASSMGMQEESLAEASSLVAAEEAKEAAREAIRVSTESQDWWALLDAIQQGQSHGLPVSETTAASQVVAQQARTMVQSSVEGGGGLDDVQAAWELGKAAGLPAADLAQVTSALSDAARQRLQAAQGTDATPDQLVEVLRTEAEFLTADQLQGGEASLRSKVSSWLAANSLSSGSHDVAATLHVLNALASASAMLGEGQLDQAVAVFRAQLSKELQEAADAASLSRLNSAIAAASAGTAHLDFMAGTDGEDEVAAAAAEQQAADFAALAARASEVRATLDLKAEAFAELEAAMGSLDINVLQDALDLAYAAGCTSAEVSSYTQELERRKVDLASARDQCISATSTGSRRALDLAIRNGEEVGLDFWAPEVMQAARAALEALQDGSSSGGGGSARQPPSTPPPLSLMPGAGAA